MRHKPRVVIFGSSGLLGHFLSNALKSDFNVFPLTRNDLYPTQPGTGFGYKEAEVCINEAFRRIIPSPTVVINCIGELAGTPSNEGRARKVEKLFWANAIVPRLLSKLCAENDARLINFSTDAVFNSKQGKVSELDTPVPDTIYGQSKLFGEDSGGHVLNIRTSFIIRPKTSHHRGLWAWVNAQKNEKTIPGFENILWTGATGFQLYELLRNCINDTRLIDQTNVLHFCPNNPISKLDAISEIIKIENYSLSVVPSLSPNSSHSRHLITELSNLFGFSVGLCWATEIKKSVSFEEKIL